MKIKDLTNGEVFEYGESHHHALRISADGKCLYFEHLQNGDGSLGEYRFVDDYEEKIPDETETVKRYGPYCYFNIGGFDKGYDIDKIDKLAHYEDLEEQGRLIELPCAVGDTIYEVHDGEIRTNRLGSKWRITRYLEEGFLGELVFTTKEEAEAKLAELKGE